jgi:murein lipoprotein
MSLTKQHLTNARRLGVAIVATLALTACATKEDIEGINSRLDSIDARVNSAAQSAQSADQNAQRANQRLDQMEGRIQQLESQPARGARG